MNNPTALVKKMYECFNNDDLETIRNEVFAPDLEWRLPGRHPLAGTKYSPDEVLAFFAQLRTIGFQVDLITLDNFGENTAVEVHRGHGEANGFKLDALNCTHYHIRDGKIADVQVYISDQYSVDQFFCSIYAYAPIPDRLARN